MSRKSRKERLATLLEEILDNHIAPDHQNEPKVKEAREFLENYWTSREATNRDHSLRNQFSMRPGIGKLRDRKDHWNLPHEQNPGNHRRDR